MDLQETKKRIEYRANLKIVRNPEMMPVRQITDNEEKSVVREQVKQKPLLPKEPSGYIKCKKHDFF